MDQFARESDVSDLSTDAELAEALVAREPEAYRRAIGRYTPQLLRLVRRIVGPTHAEDVVQDVWLIVLEKIETFENRSSFSTWISNIARNRAISLLRIQAARPEIEGSDVLDELDWFDPKGHWMGDASPVHMSPPDELMAMDSLRNCIEKHIGSMNGNQRAVLLMRDSDQMPFEKICNELGLTASNARVLLHRGRASLMAMIKHFDRTGNC